MGPSASLIDPNCRCFAAQLLHPPTSSLSNGENISHGLKKLEENPRGYTMKRNPHVSVHPSTQLIRIAFNVCFHFRLEKHLCKVMSVDTIKEEINIETGGISLEQTENHKPSEPIICQEERKENSEKVESEPRTAESGERVDRNGESARFEIKIQDIPRYVTTKQVHHMRPGLSNSGDRRIRL